MFRLFFTAASHLFRAPFRGVALVGLVLLTTPALAADTGFKFPTATHSPNEWSDPTNAFSDNGQYATASADNDDQGYANFDFPTIPAGSIIDGIEVKAEARSTDSSGCRLQVRLSWNNGSDNTDRQTAELTGTDTVHTLGGATDTWGRTWSPSEFTNANFVAEVRNEDADGAGCTDGSTTRLDYIQVKVYYSQPVPNPPLTATCGLDMALVMDISSSISSAEYAEMVVAMSTFVTALDGTPTHFSLVVFATDATVVHSFTEDGTAIIDEMTPRPGDGFTNWDDALRAARGLFPHRPNPDLIMFASDGNPNRRGGSQHSSPDPLGHTTTVQDVSESDAMTWAVAEADAAKTSGIHMISVGIGNELDEANLARVASPDDVVTADFGTLAAALLEVAEALCGGTITVHKVIDNDGNTSTTGDQSDGEGWTFACNALNPDSCTPTSDDTDDEGLIGFEINLGADTTATVSVVETGELGYAFVSASCLDKGVTAVGTPAVNAVNGITVTPSNIISCTFYNSPLCGDGLIISPETCDDDNTTNGDGCSSTCQTEPGYGCTGTPSTCSPVCGNGIITSPETCDDNDTTSGDGCSSTCQTEPGYTCTGTPSVCILTCGNGIITSPETCDDNNTSNGDGCSSTCQTEPGYGCTGTPSTCSPVCGNGIITSPETCDDNNTSNGDGCSSTCQTEPGYGCTGTPSTCSPVCGNGIITSPETCDDNNTSNGDGCSSTCQTEPGYGCTGTPSTCSPVCGNGIITSPETCDDGNTNSEDGCSSTCQTEPGYGCTGEPSTCNSVCGDGIITSPETCDDGNTNSEDGCSATCQDECVNPESDCPAPSQCQIAVCEPTAGNGAICGTSNVSDGTSCDDGDACTQSDTCEAGSCTGSNPVTCTAQDQCHDAGTCDPQTGECSNPAKADGASCDDGNACTQSDTCQAGECGGSSPLSCNDENACTDDSCDPQQGCVYTPDNTNDCSDGNACNGSESCSAGTCQPGTALTCNDENACTDDSCNPASGCVYTPDNTNSCNDGNACNGSESCSAGTCQPGTVLTCNDENACTDDSCNPANGCVYTPDNTNSCNDGNACNGSESCSAGMCQPGTALTCNDENACTDDSCNPASGCVYTPDNTNSCNDGNACNGSESCSAGTCQPGTAPNCNDSNPCTSDFCDQSLGCMNDPTPLNGQECNDGNSQTINDRCQNGICEGDLPPASVCGNGVIEAGETCDDTNLLNGDGCSSTCQDECVTPATDCQLTDQQCEVAVCVATTGGGARCKVNNRPNGTACNDGSAETSPDQCSQGDCVGGFAYPTCAPASCGPAACGTPTIVGTSKNDTLSGTIGGDVIAGNGGNDSVKAMEGNDCTVTGSGKDRVEGQKGNDKIVDTGGSNTLNGGEGQDCIFGGVNEDTISGDDGCDVISGSDGADTIEGRWGGDVITGGASNDKIFGNEGSDLIYGGEGNDTIDGGSEGGDIDSCDGGPGTDTCKNCEITINCESIK